MLADMETELQAARMDIERGLLNAALDGSLNDAARSPGGGEGQRVRVRWRYRQTFRPR